MWRWVFPSFLQDKGGNSDLKDNKLRSCLKENQVAYKQDFDILD